MRVATFNILHGQRVTDPKSHAGIHQQDDLAVTTTVEPLIEAVAGLDADIFALQEVDKFQTRSGDVDQAFEIATSLGIDHWRFVPTVIGTPGGRQGFRATTAAEIASSQTARSGEQTESQYGVALFSKLPVTKWQTKVFPAAPFWLPLLVQSHGKPRLVRVRDEQRAAIAATISTPGGDITVVSAHLSFVPGFNIRQLRQIREWLKPMGKPTILIGDFNLPSPFPARTTAFQPLVAEATFPSYRPRIQFDHILTSGFSEDAVSTAKQSVNISATGISDHCAVVADLPI